VSGIIRYHWIPAKYFSKRTGPIQSIILHATEGTKAGDIPTLVGGDGRKVSVHWYVTREGDFYHFVQDADIANHAGAVNQDAASNAHSIGIEQEYRAGVDTWTNVQIQSCANLVAFLMQKHGGLKIFSHAEVAAPKGRKSDPENYPWNKFHALLQESQIRTWSAEQIV